MILQVRVGLWVAVFKGTFQASYNLLEDLWPHCKSLGEWLKIHLLLKTIQRWHCLANRSGERCHLALWMCSCLLFNEDSKYIICAQCKSKNIGPGDWEFGILIQRHKRRKYAWNSGRGWNNLKSLLDSVKWELTSCALHPRVAVVLHLSVKE